MRRETFAALVVLAGSAASANGQSVDKVIVVPNSGVYLPDARVFVPNAAIHFSFRGQPLWGPGPQGRDFCDLCRCCYRPPDIAGLQRMLAPYSVKNSDMLQSFGVDLKKLEAAKRELR